VYLRELATESETLVAAMQDADDPAAAVEAFVRAGIRWHLEDLDRFRLIYAVNQLAANPETVDEDTKRSRIYPVTGRIYTTLENALRELDLPAGMESRQLAVALHMMLLGIACYAGTLEAGGETFLHAWEDIGEAMVRVVVRSDA
jgi:hypothetical protein